MQFPEKLWESYDESDFLTHEKKMMNKYGKEAKQSGESYVKLAMQLTKEKNYTGAVTVFKRNVKAFSGYPKSYEWLGDAYEKNQNYAQAIESYQKAHDISLEINFGQEKEYKSKIKKLKNRLV